MSTATLIAHETEQIAAQRAEGERAATALLLPAVALAQQLTAQIVAHALPRKFSGDHESYEIRDFEYLTGRLGKRRRHVVSVLCCQPESMIGDYTLFWRPETPQEGWDPNDPPQLTVASPGHGRETVRLATADELACFSQDALVILRRMHAEQTRRTTWLREGLDATTDALALLS